MTAKASSKAEGDPKAVDWTIPVELCWPKIGQGIAEGAGERSAVEEASKILDPNFFLINKKKIDKIYFQKAKSGCRKITERFVPAAF